MKSENVMQLPNDIYVSSVTFRPHTLCLFAESLFAWCRGVSSCQKHTEIEGKS